MKQALDAFEKYLHQTSDLPVLVRLALIHYQFEAIHPFSDGNGRVGRLLLTLLLLTEKLLPEALLYLAFFERHRREYYDHVLAVSQAGRWDAWIRFVLTGIAEQSRAAIDTANALLDLQQQYKTSLRKMEVSNTVHYVAERLFSRPATTIGEVASDLGLTHRGASLVVAKLMEAGILAEITGRERNRIFLARGIMSVIQGDDRPRRPRPAAVAERTRSAPAQASRRRGGHGP